MKRKLSPRIKCISCDNNLVKLYLAESGGNKRPIGLFCVHCDYPRNPEGWFVELKFKKIKETEEKRKYQKHENKFHCAYCGGTKYRKEKDRITYTKYPVFEKDGITVKKFVEKELSKEMIFHCKNPKCKTETHKGRWTVSEQLT